MPIVAAKAQIATTATTGTLPGAAANWNGGVGYGAGVYLATVASSTTAAYSTDGLTWTTTTLPAAVGWNYVDFGNGVFFANPFGATSTCATSTDGITWTARTKPSSTDTRGAAYGPQGFSIVTLNGTASYVSTDAVTWTTGTLPSTAAWATNAYGNGVYVALGDALKTASSTDGVTWSAGTLPSIGTRTWQTLGFGGGKFIVVSGGGTGGAAGAYSTDGVTWTQTTVDSATTGLAPYGYGWGAGWHVVSYGGNVGYSFYSYSTDGISWTRGSRSGSASGANWQGAAYGHAGWVSVRYGSTTSNLVKLYAIRPPQSGIATVSRSAAW